VDVSGTYTPVSLGVICETDIGEIQGFLPGPHTQLVPRHGTDKDNPKVGLFIGKESPATPQNPVIISVWSNQPISVPKVVGARINITN
jgi:hypothetical protein